MWVELKHPVREGSVEKMREPTNSNKSFESPPPESSAAEAESSEDREAETPEGRAGLERDWEELPSWDDETKVVLLPVNPYLVHVYWGIAARDLKKIGRVFSRLGPRAQPVLRFYDGTQKRIEGTNPQCWREVEVALGAGSWYVHLESPAKSYYTDLGLRFAGGGFLRLARSNVAETPRAGPSDKAEESYFLVKGDRSPLESAGQERLWESRSTHRSAERQGGEATGLELGAGSLHGAEPSVGSLQSRPPYTETQAEEPKGPEGLVYSPLGAEPSGGGLRSRPIDSEAQSGEAEGPEEAIVSPHGLKALDAGSPTAPPYAAPQEIERELLELSQQGEWRSPGVPTQPSITGGPQPSGGKGADLTDLSERSFRAGLSSGQKSS